MTKLIKISSVMETTGLSRSFIYALVAEGRFPKPVKLSERSSAWVEAEVMDWIDARIQARDHGVA